MSELFHTKKSGNGSNGELIVDNCDPEKNTLVIGENVKIGRNIRFVFNGKKKLIIVANNAEIPDRIAYGGQIK